MPITERGLKRFCRKLERAGRVAEDTVSGVQRLLDARGQRGSWMPSNIFYFLVVHQNFSNSSHKISDDLFSHLPKFLSIFSLFRIRFQISRKFAPWMPPSAASYPGNDIFLFPFSHLGLPTFLRKLAPWMPPGVDVRDRPRPPMHATDYMLSCEISINLKVRNFYK